MDALMMATADIGLIGLAVMGSNLALNIAENGYTIAVHNRSAASKHRRLRRHEAKEQGLDQQDHCRKYDLAALRPVGEAPALHHHHGQGRQAGRRDDRAAPAAPRGRATPSSSAATRSTPTRQRRYDYLKPKGISAISASASPAARRGRATVPRSWSAAPSSSGTTPSRCSTAIAAQVQRRKPCCAYLGEGGAGHFVKTIHNGIEYGDMQMIAETYGVMRDGLGMNAGCQAADVFKDWNQGPLNSYLIEITGHVLAGDR
jgi:6-phosphogluconate dehydrogenase